MVRDSEPKSDMQNSDQENKKSMKTVAKTMLMDRKRALVYKTHLDSSKTMKQNRVDICYSRISPRKDSGIVTPSLRTIIQIVLT